MRRTMDQPKSVGQCNKVTSKRNQAELASLAPMEPKPELRRPAINAKHKGKHNHAKMKKGDIKKKQDDKKLPNQDQLTQD